MFLHLIYCHTENRIGKITIIQPFFSSCQRTVCFSLDDCWLWAWRKLPKSPVSETFLAFRAGCVGRDSSKPKLETLATPPFFHPPLCPPSRNRRGHRRKCMEKTNHGSLRNWRGPLSGRRRRSTRSITTIPSSRRRGEASLLLGWVLWFL